MADTEQPVTTPTPLRTVSYGGGVQSTALLVLAAQRQIDYPLFLMANVGDDSEHPDTIRYVRDIAKPYAAEHGIELVELDRTKRDGTVETLYGRLVKEGSRSLPIPVRMSNGAPGTRSCTMDFKIRVIGKELKRRGATEDNPATVAIGFSTDEMHRANRKRAQPWEIPAYPLLDLGLSRSACQALIARAGLPVPPKSACWFCPFHRPATWAEMRRDEPDLFDRSVQLERLLNDRRDQLGKDHVYLTRFARPLDEAIAEAQPTLTAAEGPEGCDEGHCWT